MIIAYFVLTSTLTFFSNPNDAIFVAKGWDETITTCQNNWEPGCADMAKIYGLDCNVPYSDDCPGESVKAAVNDAVYRFGQQDCQDGPLPPTGCVLEELEIKTPEPKQVLVKKP